jgi:cell division protein FtsI (penicillin-binding protein 3)
MQTQECERACIILTNPQTGEILALATYPGFDPNKPGQAAAGARKCWPITDVMEHGSTLKILPFSGALTKNLYKKTDSIFCENGHYRVRGAVIHDAHPQGMLTFAEVLARSSNIGAAKIAERLGKNDLYSTARRLGFGNPTGIAFPGEQAGYLPPPHKWTGPSLANIAFGHGLSATPLQIVMAYGTIANGGYLMEPRIVKRIFHSTGEIEEFTPSIVRQALSQSVARTLTELLVGVVKDGTGKAAEISPWRIAGKTGTGQKINHETNRYYEDRFVSSFVGFVPAESPCYLMLVLVDDPQGQHYASQVAAPVFRNAMARILECRPPAPTIPQFPETSPPNDLTELMIESPPEEIIESVQNYNYPHAQETIVPAALADGMETGYIQIPSVQGLPFRLAIYEMTSRNLDVRVLGRREVVSQNPPPGSVVPVGTICILRGLEEKKN